MEFNYIMNPKSGKRVYIYSSTGKKILRNYVKYLTLGGGKKTTRKKALKKQSFLDLILSPHLLI